MRKIITLSICSCVSMVVITSAKVLIITHSYNRPDFIEMQDKTFKKFLTDDYDFVVFNDARDQNMAKQINDMCIQCNIRCIRIPQGIHDQPYLPRLPDEDYHHPTVRNVNVVQYSLNLIGFDHDDIVVLLDSDLFLVKKLSVREFLKDFDIGGMQLSNGHVDYLWHGLAFLDMRTLPNKRSLNFNCGRVRGRPIDAGGHSYYYLKDNPSLKVSYVNYHYSRSLYCSSCRETEESICLHNTNELKELGFDDHQIRFLQTVSNIEFFHNNSFMHYRGGTNWTNHSKKYHQHKTAALHTYMNAILNS
jgi:hypothetical protein